MLILVGVTIRLASEGNLFSKAREARDKTNTAIHEEQELANGIIEGKSIDEWVNGETTTPTGEEDTGAVNQDGEEFSPIYTSTQEYTDDNGDTAVIPKGFRVGTSEGINTVENGLVIQDARGNEFVWIPVNYTASGTQDAHGLDGEFLNTFKRRPTGASYTEPYANGYTGEDTDYYAMMQSVQANHGFYVGRYEVGTNQPRYYNQENETSDVYVVKRDMYPYNNVGWGISMDNYTDNVIDQLNNNYDQGYGAVYISKHFYDEQDVGVTSSLCYGVQWDAMLNLIHGSLKNHYMIMVMLKRQSKI